MHLPGDYPSQSTYVSPYLLVQFRQHTIRKSPDVSPAHYQDLSQYAII